MNRNFGLILPTTALSIALAACAATPAPATSDRLAAAMASQPVVLLGEIHDNAAQHALRAAALQRLLDSGARPALLMEQFDRDRQEAIDAALRRPGVTPDDVIAAGAPGDLAMQGWSWPLYRPYLALAIRYRLPLLAANVSREDTRRVLRDGLPALGFDAAVPEDIAGAQAAAIAAGHCGMIDAPTARRMVSAQVARDQFMARLLAAHADAGAVLLAGDGHVRRDIGVPRWLDPATRARSVSIGLLEGDDAASTGAYDVTLGTVAQPRPDPCGAMRGAPPR